MNIGVKPFLSHTADCAPEQGAEWGKTAEQMCLAEWDVCRGIRGDLLTRAVL